MKLLVCDKQGIKKYKLPERVEDFYVLNYKDDFNEEIISLQAKDEFWNLNTDQDTKIIMNGSPIEQVALKPHECFNVNFNGMEQTLTFVSMPDIDQYNTLKIKDPKANLTIGASNCDINYPGPGISPVHGTITFDGTNFIIKSEQTSNIYVNDIRIESKKLDSGDVIFVNGLQIIWMNDFLKVNSPHQKINISGRNLEIAQNKYNFNYTPATEAERNSKLYNENQIFFHTPRLKNKLKPYETTITQPPSAEKYERTPLIITMGMSLVMAFTGVTTALTAYRELQSKNIDQYTAIVQIVSSLLMVTVSLALPIITEAWNKKMYKKKEQKRLRKYHEYIKEKDAEIEKNIKEQEIIIKDNNYSIEDIKRNIENTNNNIIWNREIQDDDFLNIRLGLGSCPAYVKIKSNLEEFTLEDDKLRDELKEIINRKRTLLNIPITYSLAKNRVIPVIINNKKYDETVNYLLLQLLFYHSGSELKTIIMTDEEKAHKWDYMKYLPHNWDAKRERRYFATNEVEYQELSKELEKIHDERKEEFGENSNEEDQEKAYQKYKEFYLIITDEFKSIKEISIINKILDDNANIGFSIMVIDSSLKNLPGRAENFIAYGVNESGIFNRNMATEKQINFTPEFLEDDLKKYTTVLANIPMYGKNSSNQLPASLTFLDMYGVGKIDQLNIANKWVNNVPTGSLATPVGVRENGKLLELDLHEKFHGPHGLIAGTTGSGKSEFIITYILSMAVNYHPYEVQFVLIDYKGGGLAGAFENRETGVKIPHLVGTITNLDTSEMSRTLVSIKSELKRRQVKFNEARESLGEGTIDIYKYQKLYREGKVKEPMAHLFIISDEFAELKDQQPEFMDELVSTARIGRSLGIHLILATQKPSGVVNEQIWSNSRFKVCLKVQTEEDSKEMLKREDAASIKEAGRFYLQVGANEIFEIGQSGWAGAKYIPVDKVIKKANDDIEFVSLNGEVIKKVNDEVKKDVANQGEQLTNIVKYLYDLSNKHNVKTNQLWLPSIPEEIYLGNVAQKYGFQPKPYEFKIPVGEYDKPEEQKQSLWLADLTCQNGVIYGLSGSGKENFLSTLMYSACSYYSPEDINFYVLDFGAETLKIFEKAPHVGCVLTISDDKKIDSFINFLQKEIRVRKELLVDYSGDYIEYLKTSGKKLPLMVFILNSYEVFAENFGDYEYNVNYLLREGSKYGIVSFVTASSINGVRTSMADNLHSKTLFQTTDPFDYKYLLEAESGRVPKKAFGRGMSITDGGVAEVQTAYINEKSNINASIRSLMTTLNEKYQIKAKDIKILPNIVKLNDLTKRTKDIKSVAIGYDRDSMDIVLQDYVTNKFSLILGDKITDEIFFMCNFIDLIASVDNIVLNIIDLLPCISTDSGNYYNNFFEDIFNEILRDDSADPTINIFIGIGNYKNALNEDEAKLLEEVITKTNTLKNNSIIILDNYSRYETIKDETCFQNVYQNKGLWVGSGFDEQEIFKVDELKSYDAEEAMQGLSYLVDNGKYNVVKTVSEEDGMDF